MLKINIRQLFLFIFVGLIVTACDEDDPVSAAQEEHLDAEGFILEDENGNELYREFEGAIVTGTGGISISVGDTLELSVHFLDHDGNEVEHEEDEGEEHDEGELQITENNVAIAKVEVEEHEEEGDDHDHDHEEEEHEMAIHIIGVSAGSTSFKVELLHEGHADYTSTNNVTITVTEAASGSSSPLACANQLCLKSCCTERIYAAK
tara:strand:+ start:413 stop:1030 length:618 start_codon:yes stop_codon:yes gene_type:complete